LRTAVPIGLVSDGDPAIQRAKLEALRLRDAFDVVVFSDELGRDCRKPNRAPFDVAVTRLGVEPGRAVYVGDSPVKDITGAMSAGLRAIRVRTGEYGDYPDDLPPWQVAPDVVEAIEMLRPMLGSSPVANARGCRSIDGSYLRSPTSGILTTGRADRSWMAAGSRGRQ
jgi:putative hydrolase of the HAD superfamily